MKNIVLLIILITFSGQLQIIYGQSSVKILKKETTYIISYLGAWKIHQKEYKSKEIVSFKTAKPYELNEYQFEDEFSHLTYLKGSTYVPRGNGKYKKVPSKSIIEENYNSNGIFFSGITMSTLTFPKLADGLRTESESLMYLNKPELLTPFYFDDISDCDTARLIIKLDKDIELSTIPFFYEFADNITFREEEGPRNTRVLIWTAVNLKQRIYEDNDLGKSCRSPHLVFHIRSYKAMGKTNYVLRDKDDLFRWYTSLITEEKLNPEFQPVIDSLSSGTDDEVLLAEKIYNWVQHNIKYIAFEDGMGGFIPRSPNVVMKRRFGDCKDMAMLTKTMMNAVGLPCYIAWIGTRNKCYTYDECPTPSVDNHMIAVFPIGEEVVFLDPTSSFSEFGRPSGFIQGKEAMVRLDSLNYKIMQVPVMEANTNTSVDSIWVEINGARLTGKGRNILNGYEKEHYEYARTYYGKDDMELFTDYNTLGNNSFEISSFDQRNTNTNSGPIDTYYNFELNKYCQIFDNSIYLKPLLKNVIEEPLFNGRKSPYSVPHKYEKRVHINIKLPDGINVENKLISDTLSANGMSFLLRTKYTANNIIIDYAYVVDRLLLNPDEFTAINAFYQALQQKMNHQLELIYEIN